MPDSDSQDALHVAVDRYLSTLSAVGDCLNKACPAVGGPYRHKLIRTRTRLAFDSSAEHVDASFTQLTADLAHYAQQASRYLDHHTSEMQRATEELEKLVRKLAGRQEFYGARLRMLAEQAERAPYPADAGQFQELLARQATGLSSCLESMSHEIQSLVADMREEVASVGQRITSLETTDRATGLTNRTEMERLIAARRSSGEPVILLQFTIQGELPDEVAGQVALRLWSQFRPQDVVARWTHSDFVILFQGPPEIAESRVPQVVPWLAGRYPRDNGEIVDLQVQGQVLESTVAGVR